MTGRQSAAGKTTQEYSGECNPGATDDKKQVTAEMDAKLEGTKDT